ncbi:MAG: RNase P subunit p30 family protein [Halolamina sp.]
MYEAVHAHPDGDATAARFVATAARHGYDGVVVRTRAADYDPGALRAEYGPDVAVGIEVDADGPNSASGAVGNFRPDCEVLVVAGGSPTLNRFAVESPRVDVLARPMANDGDVNHVVAKAARDNDVAVEVDLGPVLELAGGERVQALQDLRKLREILTYYDAPHVVSANPRSHLELRAPRELVAVGEQLGFDAEWLREGLARWGEVAERTRRRRSDSFIAPGVERTEHEEEP